MPFEKLSSCKAIHSDFLKILRVFQGLMWYNYF